MPWINKFPDLKNDPRYLEPRVNELSELLAEKATKQELQNIGDASPKGTYSTLTALQTAFPTGTSGIYIVTADGKWYFWNGTAWTAGGVYQSTGLADKTVTPQKTSFFNVQKNLMNPNASDVILGGYYNISHVLTTNANNNQSGLIPVKPNSKYTASDRSGFVLFYDANKNYLTYETSTNFTSNGYVTIPSNAYYARFVTSAANWSTFQVEEGTISTSYEAYHEFEFSLADDVAKVLQEKIKYPVTGESGKRYKLVACVLRQPSSGGGWNAIIDEGHVPLNIASVTNDTFKIIVNYNFTAKKVISFVATPDEDFVQKGYSFGSSVLTDKAYITISRPSTQIEGFVYYDGTQWQISNQKGNLTIGSFSGGTLVLNHDSCGGTSPVSIQAHDSQYLVKLKSSATTHTDIQFTDYNGNVITSPDTNMKFTISRVPLTKYTNPNDLKSDSGNIWCIGIMEV